MKVLATDGFEKEGAALLQNAGFEIDIREACEKEELAQIIGKYDALIIRTATKATRDLLKNKGNLKIICASTVGVDGIDVDAATENDIVVMNVPGGNKNAVAEHTLAFMLMLARSIIPANESLKRGKWLKVRGVEIVDKTLGIIGLGNVGGTLAKKARALGMNICAVDPYIFPEMAEEIGVKLTSLDDLLARSDFVTIHVPLTDETDRMISDRQFSLMKKGAFFINCARGEVVDGDALKRAIKYRGIKAALDVFENEPTPDKELVGLANIITSHSAGSTQESRRHMALTAAQQIIDGLLHQKWTNALNLPPIDDFLEPYIKLSEMLGRFAAKLWFIGEPRRFSEINLEYSGTLNEIDTRSLTQSAVRGLISTFSSKGPVGFVNALVAAEKRGFKIFSTTRHVPIDYSNLITLSVREKGGENHNIEGTVMGEKKLQVVSIDGYSIFIEPSKIMLVFSNKDEPGVIADIAEIVGKDLKINIEKFALSDRNKDGTALAVITLSTKPSEAELMARINLKLGQRIRFAKLLLF